MERDMTPTLIEKWQCNYCGQEYCSYKQANECNCPQRTMKHDFMLARVSAFLSGDPARYTMQDEEVKIHLQPSKIQSGIIGRGPVDGIVLKFQYPDGRGTRIEIGMNKYQIDNFIRYCRRIGITVE